MTLSIPRMEQFLRSFTSGTLPFFASLVFPFQLPATAPAAACEETADAPQAHFNRGLIAKGMSCVRLCLWVHALSRANAALESIALRLPEHQPSVRNPGIGRCPIALDFYSCGVPAGFLG